MEGNRNNLLVFPLSFTAGSFLLSAMHPTEDYLTKCRELVEIVSDQAKMISQAADLFSATILAGRMVHLFGSGHSRILVEEMWPRYGSFPGFNPIVELSLTFHNRCVGANGQVRLCFWRTSAASPNEFCGITICRTNDSALVASSSGCNLVPIEMAIDLNLARIKVVAIISKRIPKRSQKPASPGEKTPGFRRYCPGHRRSCWETPWSQFQVLKQRWPPALPLAVAC